MEHLKKIEVPAYTKEVVDYTTCDLCRKKIEVDQYRVEDIEISCREGSSYPEGGMGTDTEIDLCLACFNEKLIPWLESHGAVPRKKDWDW